MTNTGHHTCNDNDNMDISANVQAGRAEIRTPWEVVADHPRAGAPAPASSPAERPERGRAAVQVTAMARAEAMVLVWEALAKDRDPASVRGEREAAPDRDAVAAAAASILATRRRWLAAWSYGIVPATK